LLLLLTWFVGIDVAWWENLKMFIIILQLFHLRFDAPPTSLMDSTAIPKMKIAEGERVGVCSLVRITLKVEGRARASGWELWRLTSKSIIHTDMHKPNNKLVSAQLKHLWCMDESQANTDSP
jgi:hypothetical protein